MFLYHGLDSSDDEYRTSIEVYIYYLCIYMATVMTCDFVMYTHIFFLYNVDGNSTNGTTAFFSARLDIKFSNKICAKTWYGQLIINSNSMTRFVYWLNN